ncbi:MAG: murein L,D-transpeptidase [Pikeienuella sp.]
MRVIVAGAAFLALIPFSATAVVDQQGEHVAEGPHGEALKLALAAPDAAAEATEAHYRESDYRGLWIGADGDDGRAQALLAALDAAGGHGLPAAAYRAEALRAAVEAAAAGDPSAVAAAELALTRAFLDYAGDIHGGVLEPSRVDRDLHVVPPVIDERALLERLAAAGDAAGFLDGLAPANPNYARLTAGLAALRALPDDAWGAPAPGGPSIRPGEAGQRVALVRARLIALGDHAAPAAPAQDPAAQNLPAQNLNIFDPALVESVRAFQRRHGLNDDGVIGARTVEAMNASIDDRIGQALVNLERLRWNNRPEAPRYIDVNQADYTVQVIDNGAILFDERVVIGSRRNRTPEFSEMMTYMVFNPTWNVPRSIATQEILPALQEDPEYLAKKNMRLISRDGTPPPDPYMTDWSLYSAGDFPFAVKQNPGGGNSLGRVKFMFPNAYSIYLHDTPSKRLFAKDARAFSHGCIRVRDPMRLAVVLLSPQEADPQALIDRLLARGREVTVNLETPIPVHLGYRTAWIDELGRSQFREDIYGRDARVLSALQAAGVVTGPDS